MKKTVMVVDDDPVVLRTLERILMSVDLDVVTADSGQACLDNIEAGFKGLILMDVVMPHMDGWDTIEIMIERGYTKGNIICMLTGKEIPDERLEALKEHVLDYIRKPFKNNQLIALVKQYLSYL